MARASLKFRTTLLKGGKTATGIEVPAEIVERLGAGKRPAVKIRLNDYTYRSTVAVMGGRFMIGVSADVREQAHVEGGDTVNVELELDTAPRVLALPDDFKKALDQDAKAKKLFEGLSYSKKQRLVIPVDKAKAVETRERNIARAMTALRSGKV